MADVSALRQQIQTRSARAHVIASGRMKTRYRQAAPYKSGDTQESVDVVNFSATSRELACTAVATTPQAEWTDKGTDPHEIRPNAKKALRFRYRGRIVFAKVVNHPGNKGTGWFSKLGARDWPGELQQAFRSLG